MSVPQKVTSLTFFADAMIRKLARWLRMLGYDTASLRDIEDDVLVQRGLQEDRWLITRDGNLVRRKILRGRHTLLRSDFVPEQLIQLHRELHVSHIVGKDTPMHIRDHQSTWPHIPNP